MGIFSGIENQTIEGLRGNYIKPGVHKLQLVRCTQGITRHRIPFVAADLKVLESEVHRSGEVVNYYQQASDMFLKNVKSFFAGIVASHSQCSINEIDPAWIDEKTAESICAEPGTSYAGVVLWVTAVDCLTKEKKHFTKLLWEAP